MTLVLNITSTFDGTTEVSFAGGSMDPVTQRFEFAFPFAGLLPLFTVPGIGSSDTYVQAVSVIAPGATDIDLELVYPSGGREVVPALPISAPPLGFWTNFIVPQGTLIKIDARDVAGAPVAGTVQVWTQGMSARTWFLFQCCHALSPNIDDSPTAGFTFKKACRVGTQANILDLGIGLQPGAVIDGITLDSGDRVLVKNQVALVLNGIYTVPEPGQPVLRSEDANETGDLMAGCIVAVTEGAGQADTVWILTSNDPIIIDVDPIVWALFGVPTGTGVPMWAFSNPTIGLSAADANFAFTGSTLSGGIDTLGVLGIGANLLPTVGGTFTKCAIRASLAIPAAGLDIFVKINGARVVVGNTGAVAPGTCVIVPLAPNAFIACDEVQAGVASPGGVLGPMALEATLE